MYFRMSPTVFDQLLALVGPTIQKTNTHYRKCIDPGERLAILGKLQRDDTSYTVSTVLVVIILTITKWFGR